MLKVIFLIKGMYFISSKKVHPISHIPYI